MKTRILVLLALALVLGAAPGRLAPTQQQINIAILSPVPGSALSGVVPIIGATQHPQFAQYQVDYAPETNPFNVWYPLVGGNPTPVINGLLGAWDTALVQDGVYQLRLQVTLRDGSKLTTVVSNLRIQNGVPPTPTSFITPPIAAFNANPLVGPPPLTVRFNNQSAGVISQISWNFGDGTISSLPNPVYTYGQPGVYTVTLTAIGPGGSSSVSQPIVVQMPAPSPSPTPAIPPPAAVFFLDTTSGNVPLTVRFTNQSTGNITGFLWDFGDGTTSADQHPVHTYSAPGTYVVRLTATGPGGQSTAQTIVTAILPPSPTPSQPQTLTLQVALSSDDVNQSPEFEVNDARIWIGTAGSETESYTGLRFANVAIPQSATILSAHLEFYSVQEQWIRMGLTMAAEAADNSATFAPEAPPSQRPLTTQQVEHQSDTPWEADTWYEFDEMAAVIQEVIDRPGWQSGNSLAIIMRGSGGSRWGRKFVRSFDGDPALAPRLVITYQAR